MTKGNGRGGQDATASGRRVNLWGSSGKMRIRREVFTEEQLEALQEMQLHNVPRVEVFSACSSLQAQVYDRLNFECHPTKPLLRVAAELASKVGIRVEDMYLALINGRPSISDFAFSGHTPLPLSAGPLLCDTVHRLNHALQPPHPSEQASKFTSVHHSNNIDYTPAGDAECTRWNARVAASVIALSSLGYVSALTSEIAQLHAISILPLSVLLPRSQEIPKNGSYSTLSNNPHQLCGMAQLCVGYKRGMPDGLPVSVKVEFNNGLDVSASTTVSATVTTSLGLFLRHVLTQITPVAPAAPAVFEFDPSLQTMPMEIVWDGLSSKDEENAAALRPWRQALTCGRQLLTLGDLGASNSSVLILTEIKDLGPQMRIIRGRPFTDEGIVAEVDATNSSRDVKYSPWTALTVNQILHQELCNIKYYS